MSGYSLALPLRSTSMTASKSYFDTIPKDRLMALIRQKVADTRVLALIESFLEQGVLDGNKERTPVKACHRALWRARCSAISIWTRSII
jgi:hypothetical protein